ncbi:amidophosphoribosyltransferase [Neisseria gonorrhoeae]|uniref:Amidophosphoribosyltransferase n=1 Tax=Neisseria gonorrhoeae TaxID=485 RepID=A0A378W1I4_NEIGO|nr:amidophosphoribosyltransferase [Neisseria gonorrhoeae]
MCGVLGLVSHEPVNQLLYDGLQMLQHRGRMRRALQRRKAVPSICTKAKGW